MYPIHASWTHGALVTAVGVDSAENGPQRGMFRADFQACLDLGSSEGGVVSRMPICATLSRLPLDGAHERRAGDFRN